MTDFFGEDATTTSSSGVAFDAFDERNNDTVQTTFFDEDDDEESVQYRLNDDDVKEEEPKQQEEPLKEETEVFMREREDDDKKQEPDKNGEGFSLTRWLGETMNTLEQSPTVRRVVRWGWIPLVIGMGIATIEPGVTLVDVLAPINFRDRSSP